MALTTALLALADRLRSHGLAVAPTETADALAAVAAVGLTDRTITQNAVRATMAKSDRAAIVFDREFESLFATLTSAEIDAMAPDRPGPVPPGVSFTGEARTGPDRPSDPEDTLHLFQETDAEENGTDLDNNGRRQPPADSSSTGTAVAGDHASEALAPSGLATADSADADADADAQNNTTGVDGEFILPSDEGTDGRADELLADEAEDLDALHAQLLAARDARLHRLGEFAATPSGAAVLANPLSDFDRRRLANATDRFTRRLDHAAHRRLRHGPVGRLDGPRTMAQSLATGGVPLRPSFRDRHRSAPQLMVLCDVSLSTRTTARLVLYFAATLARQRRTRVFAFVDDTVEITADLRARPINEAIGAVFDGSLLDPVAPSDYGTALATFSRMAMPAIGPHTTVVILGDGRSNGKPHRPELVADLRRRAAAVLWLTPEREGWWPLGLGEMADFAAASDEAITVRDFDDLLDWLNHQKRG